MIEPTALLGVYLFMETLPETRKNSRTWMMLCHLSALAGFIIPAAGHIIGPLIVWLVKRDEFPEVDDQGKESLTFQLSMFLYTVLLGIVCFVLAFVLIGFLLLPLFGVLWVLDIVLVIIASLKANEGQLYRYPMTIRLLK